MPAILLGLGDTKMYKCGTCSQRTTVSLEETQRKAKQTNHIVKATYMLEQSRLRE